MGMRASFWILAVSIALNSSANAVELQSFPETQVLSEQSVETRTSNGAHELSSYYLMTPVIVSAKALQNIRANGISTGTEKSIREDSKYVAGYVAIAYALNRFSNAFLMIDHKDFEKKAFERMKPHPNKVLYINLIDDKDRLAGFPQADFERLYGSHPNATFLKAESMSDLAKKLKALPQDSSIERIEVFGHGRPGAIKIGKNEVITSQKLEPLKAAKLEFAVPGADIRFISCSLAANQPSSDLGEKFLSELGAAFLTKGGTAIGAPKNILAVKLPEIRALQHAMGVSNISDLVMQVLPNLYRNYSQTRASLIEAKIPAPSSNSSCVSAISAKISRIR